MNISEFKKIFNNVELSGNKIILQDNLAKTVEFVKDNYKFDMLKEIIAVDNGEHGIELNYHLYSVENHENLILTINSSGTAESVSNIYDSAIADENEIYDLFGINFIDNENLKRLYMPETWKGHPLLKDYKEDDERLRWNDKA